MLCSVRGHLLVKRKQRHHQRFLRGSRQELPDEAWILLHRALNCASDGKGPPPSRVVSNCGQGALYSHRIITN